MFGSPITQPFSSFSESKTHVWVRFDRSGKAVVINIMEIISMFEQRDGTLIRLSTGDEHMVDEAVGEVMEKMAKHLGRKVTYE